jgi:hypothetical protein
MYILKGRKFYKSIFTDNVDLLIQTKIILHMII